MPWLKPKHYLNREGKAKLWSKKKAKVSRATKSYVNRMISKNQEDKRLIYNLGGGGFFSSITNAWEERSLCEPTQGDTSITRTGNKIKIKSILVRGVISGGVNELLTDDAYNIVRCIISWYKPSTSTPLATAGSLLGSYITCATTMRNYMEHKMLDKYITFQVTSTEKGGGDGYTPTLKQFKYYKRFYNKYITFGDDTATYPNRRLMMACISDSGAVTNPGFLTGHIVVTFEDA